MTKELKTDSTEEEIKKQTDDDKVTVSKSKLNEIIDRINKLERGEGITLEAPLEYKARIRKFNEGYVVGYVLNPKYESNVWTVRDPDTGEEKDYITLQILKGDKIVEEEVNYLEFIRKGIQIEVKIKETKIKMKKLSQGYTNLIDENKTTGMPYNTGIRVPMEVIYEDKESVIELPDGREITINHKFLNM